MKDRILQALRELRAYGLDKGYDVELLCHDEDGSLMRFANSAISLNTSEHLLRLEITAHAGRKRASSSLITDLGKRDEMRQAMDMAAQAVEHSHPLMYEPTVPEYRETVIDEQAYDPALAHVTSAQKLEYFSQAVQGLETPEVRLSGIFSSGSNIIAAANTRSEHMLYFRTSDAEITAVLAHSALKWEVRAGQSAQAVSDLDPYTLRQELVEILAHYRTDTPQQLPIGTYDIVFGSSAVADMVGFMNWIGYNGGLYKRGYSFLTEQNVGQRVFSDQFSLTDDPERRETFPFRADLTGIPRQYYPIIDQGVFQGFLWSQDDADEFGEAPTGHTVPHKSLVVRGGAKPLANLAELVALPRERDCLYIPHLHYTNIVNPSKGVITGSSRFGALLLKADGSVQIPYNVRITQSLLDMFGDRVQWLSRDTLPCNTSHSYGGRNPSAVIVPRFMCVRDLAISHSNASF